MMKWLHKVTNFASVAVLHSKALKWMWRDYFMVMPNLRLYSHILLHATAILVSILKCAHAWNSVPLNIWIFDLSCDYKGLSIFFHFVWISACIKYRKACMIYRLGSTLTVEWRRNIIMRNSWAVSTWASDVYEPALTLLSCDDHKL
jgi:hypothetical protein